MSVIASIILPTYNRERFLPEAFESIRGQRFTDWELIVVDDGSTDGTRGLVEKLSAEIEQPVQYIYQENQGPGAARNTGLDHAEGKYVAFFDSDDYWFPHHLADCVEALEANLDIDWVYAATRMIDANSGRVLIDNTFHTPSGARPFTRLQTLSRGKFLLIDDELAAETAIRDALYAGLQTSVLRRSVFDQLRIPEFRVGEDQVFTVVALKSGCRIAYTRQVHVLYRAHADSISAGVVKSADETVRAYRELARAFEWLLDNVQLKSREVRALRNRLAREYFWHIGYCLLESGDYVQARAMFRKGISYSPFRFGFWKTYFLSCIKQLLNRINHQLSDIRRGERING